MLSRRDVVRAGLVTGALVPFGIAARAAEMPNELLEQHIAARGGREAMAAVTGMTTSLEINEQGATVNGYYAALRVPAPRMRIDVIYQGTRVWSEGLDSAGAWKMEQKATAPEVSTKGAGALEHGIVFNLYGLESIASLGGKLVDAGMDPLDGVHYRVLRATLADGFTTSFYIDPETHLIARRRDVRPLHPDIDMTFKPLENRFEDYRAVSGIMTSFKSSQIDLTTGKVAQTTVNTALAYNPPLTEAQLARTAPPLKG